MLDGDEVATFLALGSARDTVLLLIGSFILRRFSSDMVSLYVVAPLFICCTCLLGLFVSVLVSAFFFRVLHSASRSLLFSPIYRISSSCPCLVSHLSSTPTIIILLSVNTVRRARVLPTELDVCLPHGDSCTQRSHGGLQGH